MCPLSRAAVMRIHKVCGPCAVHSACSVAASYMPSMHVTRVQLSACALLQPRSHFGHWGFTLCGQTPHGAVVRHPLSHADGHGFDSPCAQPGGQAPHGPLVGDPLHMRTVLGSNPRVPRGVAKRRMVRWSDTCCKCGRLGFESQCAIPSGRPGHNE